MADFAYNKTLGEGAFGKVYLVTNTHTKTQYAMKVIDLRNSPQTEKDLALAEAGLLKKLKHECVLSLTDSFEKDGALCIVTEYCANGDLSQYLERQEGVKLDEGRLITWFQQITQAVQYLHSQKIIHRDLKTPNVFLMQNWDAKLGDFGLAKVLERPTAKAVTFCGSPYYMSPEIFSAKPYDNKSDIWALGVIVYEMSTLERPFDAILMHQLVFKIVHGGLPKMPTGYADGVAELLAKMMQKDSTQRPTADEILAHPLFGPKRKLSIPVQETGQPGSHVKSRWGYKGQQKANGEAKPSTERTGGPFDMNILLDSLTVARKEAAKKVPAGVDISSIMAKTYVETNDKSKTVKRLPSKTIKAPSDSVTSTSDVNLLVGDELDQTLKASGVQVERAAFDVMQMVVGTLTGVYEKPVQFEDKGDHETKLLTQIHRLQTFCTQKMGKEVLSSVYDLLGKEKNEDKLEEELVRVIGKDNFVECGVQLMYLKNLEYNLHKLSK